MPDTVPAWQRLADETAAAYAAFCSYYLLPPRERSIDRAWRDAANEGQNRDGKRAPGNWAAWSATHHWVKRALAHDEHVAEQNRLLWEERRTLLREQDWEMAQTARGIIAVALPEASGFIQRTERFLPGENGAPNTVIITEQFNISALMRALTEASKLQRLATDEPTENIKLTGSALDAYIARQLARVANGGETGVGNGPEPDAAETDSETDADDPDL